MEITDDEKRLIIAMRSFDEIPINFLLWYSTGKKDGFEKSWIHRKEDNPFSVDATKREKILLEKINQFLYDFRDIKID